jgi:hypothetical protein
LAIFPDVSIRSHCQARVVVPAHSASEDARVSGPKDVDGTGTLASPSAALWSAASRVCGDERL